MRFAVLVVVISSCACGFIPLPKGPTTNNNNGAKQVPLKSGNASVTATSDTSGSSTFTSSTLDSSSEIFVDAASISTFTVLFSDGNGSQLEVSGSGTGLKTGTFDTAEVVQGATVVTAFGVNFDGPNFSYSSDDSARKCSITINAFSATSVSGSFGCPKSNGDAMTGNWSASQ